MLLCPAKGISLDGLQAHCSWSTQCSHFKESKGIETITSSKYSGETSLCWCSVVVRALSSIRGELKSTRCTAITIRPSGDFIPRRVDLVSSIHSQIFSLAHLPSAPIMDPSHIKRLQTPGSTPLRDKRLSANNLSTHDSPSIQENSVHDILFGGETISPWVLEMISGNGLPSCSGTASPQTDTVLGKNTV